MLLNSANHNAENFNFNVFQNNIISYYAFTLKFFMSTDNVDTINNVVHPTITLTINTLNTITTSTTSWGNMPEEPYKIFRASETA